MEPSNLIVLTEENIGSLAPVPIRQPPGTFALTPASLITAKAISDHQELLAGVGIDWGCGTGCLTIVAAKIGTVRQVIGLDLCKSNVIAALENAVLNSVTAKTTFVQADSYIPLDAADIELLDGLRGIVDFIVANPPGSEAADGLEPRRAVLSGAVEFLRPGGIVLVQISRQYGETRIRQLANGVSGLEFEAMFASTPWVEFDLARPDLIRLLEVYVEEERRGGPNYTFGDPRNGGFTHITAAEAADLFRASGLSPLSKWQVQLYRYRRPLNQSRSPERSP